MTPMAPMHAAAHVHNPAHACLEDCSASGGAQTMMMLMLLLLPEPQGRIVCPCAATRLVCSCQIRRSQNLTRLPQGYAWNFSNCLWSFH